MICMLGNCAFFFFFVTRYINIYIFFFLGGGGGGGKGVDIGEGVIFSKKPFKIASD